jgi:hypothetical protein
MALKLVMTCDLKHCTQTITEGESLIGWWSVCRNEDDTITVNKMANDDFKESQYDRSTLYCCCMEHASKLFSEYMSEIQSDAIAESHSSGEETKIVAVMDEIVSKYPDDFVPLDESRNTGFSV